MEYLISIIIPVYNVERYILRCLHSVSSQTNTECVECILIDDCGFDNSINLAKIFIDNYKGNINFKLISHTQNKGLSAARNTGIKNASGKYLYFLDSDDEILPETVEKFKYYLNKWNDVDCLVGDVYASYPFSQWIRVKNNDEFIYRGNDIVQKRMLYRSPIPVTAWNKLIKRDILIKNNLFFKEGFIHEDEIWSYYLSRYINSYGYINYASYVYYQNPNSIITNREKSITNKILILQLFLNDISERDIYARFRLIAEWIFDIHYNISLLDDSRKQYINRGIFKQTTWNFFKKVSKRRYFHITILLIPYILINHPGMFLGNRISRVFSKILRIL